MTAEIAILNRTGVALAADSAVTIGLEGSQKVYNSANKLFSLSKQHPVGVMVYGGANFMGVPWETLIKTYRRKLGNTKFNTLKEYADNFINYLTEDSRLYKETTENNLVSTIFFGKLMELLNNEVNESINEITKTGEPVTNSDVEKIMEQLLEEKLISLREQSILIHDADFPDKFLEKHYNTINGILSDVINFNLRDNVINLFVDYCSKLIQSNNFSPNYTGLVITGYGEEEIFPSLYEFHVEGIFLEHLKFEEKTPLRINSYNDETYSTAVMRPFAQKEMVFSFTHGMDPSMHQTIMDIIKNSLHLYNEFLIKEYSLNNKILEDEEGILNEIVEIINSEIVKIQNQYYTRPIVDILEVLPKEEIADMAEALVNLTSFKRRVTMDAETVGGPVDVCVITKGDGLVWIKRKHYFNPELNHSFFKNY